MHKRLVDNSIQLPHEAPEDARRAELRSQSMSLMGAFFDEGIRLAKERGLQHGSEDAWALLERAHDIASRITFSGSLMRLPFGSEERAKLTADDVRRIFRVTHDTLPRDLVVDARKGRKMEVDKGGLEDSVSGYLSSEFRLPFADRALLVALIDTEVTAYLQEVYEKNILTRQSAALVMDRAPIATWLIGRCWAIVRSAVVIAAIIGIANLEWIAGDNALLLIFGALALFAIGTVWSFVAYLSFRQRWKALRPKLVDLPAEMINFYSELHSDGPLSVKRVRQQTQRLADMGAVWPGAVWALLDDIEARGVVAMTG